MHGKPILKITASDNGVYQVAVKAGVDEYDRADRLSAALRPAIALINRTIHRLYNDAGRAEIPSRESAQCAGITSTREKP
jgi:hypothetical protein